MTDYPLNMDDDPDYQAFLAGAARHCTCSHGPCDGVLAGGMCDDYTDDDFEDDLSWVEDEDEEI